MTLRWPQGALARGAPQESTELGAQQHHTSAPTDAGGPFILTLSRGRESPLGTQGTQSNQLTLSPTGSPGKGRRIPVQAKTPENQRTRTLPPKNKVKEEKKKKWKILNGERNEL